MFDLAINALIARDRVARQFPRRSRVRIRVGRA